MHRRAAKISKKSASSKKSSKKGARTRHILDEMSQQFDDALLPEWWEIHYQKMPEYLYHYTTGGGLVGIFESNKIWASNVLYMNDRSEVLYGIWLAKNIIKDRKERATTQATKDFLTGLENMLDPTRWLFDFYAACFCAKDDVLSQWRGYAGMGNGYALAVFPEELEKGSGNGIAPNIGLRKVIYDEETQKAFVTAAISKACDLFEDETSKGRIENLPLVFRLQRKIFERLLECIVCFKDEAFREEEEWRMVHKLRSVNEENRKTKHTLPPTDEDIAPLKFRDVGGRIVPYVELDFSSSNKPNPGKLPIEAVRHGPALIPELAKKSLALMLEKYGYEGSIYIEGSDVPLRP